MVAQFSKKSVHVYSIESLSLCHWAVLVSKQQGLEINNLFPKLSDLGRQCVILLAKQFDLLLEVGQPLLLALATFERSNPGTFLAKQSYIYQE